MSREKWEDCPREDLSIIPYAGEKGWSPCFSVNDRKWNRITIDNVPHDEVGFSKGNVRTWRVIKRNDDGISYVWKVADIVNGRFTNHREYDTIREAIDNES